MSKEIEAVKFNGLKVFSATKAKERDLLGETITDWIRLNPDKIIVDKIITQSSDSEFHRLAITLFYWTEVTATWTREDDDRWEKQNEVPQQRSISLRPEGNGAVAPRRLNFNNR